MQGSVASVQGFDSSARFSQNTRPFCNLGPGTLTFLGAVTMEIDYSRGSKLFMEGQEPQCVFIVTAGRVKLSVTSRDGKTVIVRIAGPNDVLALSAALSGNDHEVTAEATEPCRVKAVRVKDFLQLLENYPEAAMEATRCILKEYQIVFNDVCRLALPGSVAGRLANLLLEWLKTRAPIGQAGRVTMSMTHEEIASMTGTSRETVSRTLQHFQREKLISIKGASVMVLRPEALEQLAI